MADAAPAAKKPCVSGAGDIAGLTNHDSRSDGECIDDKESIRNTLIVRLPTQAPNAPPSDVIVIDDSDDETDVPGDVKPNKQQLDEQLAEPSANNADTVDRKPLLTAAITDHSSPTEHGHTAPEYNSSESSEHRPQTSGQNVNGEDSGRVQAHSSSHGGVPESVMQPAESEISPSSSYRPRLSSPRRSAKSTSNNTPNNTCMQNQAAADKSSGGRLMPDRHQQTKAIMQDANMQTEHTRSAEQQLESLRSNVLQLLKTIVPTLTCNNLEFVDELVVEMVRVNAENSDQTIDN